MKKTLFYIVLTSLLIALLCSCASGGTVLDLDNTELYANSAVRLKSFGYMYDLKPLVDNGELEINTYDNTTEYYYVVYDIETGLEYFAQYQEYLTGEGGFTKLNEKTNESETGISYKYSKSTWILGLAYHTGTDPDRMDAEYIMILVSVPLMPTQKS